MGRPFLARHPGRAACEMSQTIERPVKAGAAKAEKGARIQIADLLISVAPGQ